MLSVAAAQAVVVHHARALPARAVELADALDLVLAEDIASDIDMPPHDKAMMDGYAVRVGDLPGGFGSLSVIEEITAGKWPALPLGPGQATRIMTGAPIPQGTEAVVQVERTRLLGGGCVLIEDPDVRVGQHVLKRGREMRAGEVVLRHGQRLGPQEIGVLASVGRAKVQVTRQPVLAVLPTGDELVEPGHPLEPGQIRNSNGPMLMALAERAGAEPRYLGIARDRLDSLREHITAGLEADVLLLSGGVSAGTLDLVPGVLQELEVEAHFHKVAMKPGKPVFFGTRGRTLVVGLPGNPVSTLVCFELFVRPALRLLRGLADAGLDLPQAALAEDFACNTNRPTYHPAVLDQTPSGWRVKVAPWFGSADLRGVVGCNCLIVLPPGDHLHRAGQLFPVLRLEGT